MIANSLPIIIKKYGLIAIFAGTFLEGELVLIVAAVLSGDGLQNPIGVWISATLGAWTGHIFWFFIGRIFGIRYILPRLKGFRPHFEEVKRIILTNPKTSIFILQYLYGMRIIGAMGLGFTELPILRFIFYEVLNCSLWALIIFSVGYILGETFIHIFHGWLRWIWIGLSLLILALFFRHIKIFLHSRIEREHSQ